MASLGGELSFLTFAGHLVFNSHKSTKGRGHNSEQSLVVVSCSVVSTLNRTCWVSILPLVSGSIEFQADSLTLSEVSFPTL